MLGKGKKEELSMSTMRDLLLKPLDIPLRDVEIEVSPNGDTNNGSLEMERYPLWNTSDSEAFKPSERSVDFFIPLSSKDSGKDQDGTKEDTL